MLYAATCAIVFGLEALFYAFVHVRLSQFYAELIGQPLVIVVVTVYSGCDARDVFPSAAERWARIVERAWAVIVIDVALSFVNTIGFGTLQAGDFMNFLLGTVVLFLGAMLVYAEPYACLDDQGEVLTMVFFAVLRSMMLSWVNMSRIFALFALNVIVTTAQYYVHTGAGHIMRDPVWADMAFETIVAVPLAILFTVAYLDTLSQEREMVQP